MRKNDVKGNNKDINLPYLSSNRNAKVSHIVIRTPAYKGIL